MKDCIHCVAGIQNASAAGRTAAVAADYLEPSVGVAESVAHLETGSASGRQIGRAHV